MSYDYQDQMAGFAYAVDKEKANRKKVEAAAKLPRNKIWLMKRNARKIANDVRDIRLGGVR